MKLRHRSAGRRQIRLQLVVLLPPLAVFLVVTLTVTWWASRSAIGEAEDIAQRMHGQQGARLRAEFDRLFETPERLLAANVAAARDGLLDLRDQVQLERAFAAQVRAFPNLTNLAYGSADGRYACAYRDWTEPDRILVSEAVDERGMATYRVDADGERELVLGPTPGFRVTERPWFRAGAAARGAVWYPVSGESLGTGIAQSVRDPDGAVLGVIAADPSLLEVARYLRSLDLEPDGVAFVIDGRGRLIADSTGESPVEGAGASSLQRLAVDSDHPGTRRSAELILASGNGLDDAGANRRFKLGGTTYLLRSSRYRRPGGLDLTVGIAEPRDAYSRPLTAAVKRRAGVAAVLILAGLAATLLVSRTIARPIRDLDEASRRIASGDWESPVPASRIVELSSLAGSFAAMTGRLRSMAGMLEERLKQRTAELAEANARLSELSRTDDLTGLANRRHFDEALDREWSRSRRERLPVSLLVCDVDWFKSYNDDYGHVAGDRCLQSVATALTTIARRRTDLAARIGGEEFVALLPGLDEPRAAEIAESLRCRVEGLAIGHERSPLGRVTISVGVVTMVAPGEGEPDPGSPAVVEAADRALYRAKRLGRNRVAVAG